MNKITRKNAIEHGLKHYFTGNPCKRGHICQRYTCNKKCMNCDNLHCKKYQIENKESLSIKRHFYYEKNKDKWENFSRVHKEERKANGKKYYWAHRNENRKKNREYYVNHKQERLGYQLAYAKNKIQSDPEFKLAKQLRGRIYHALHAQLKNKNPGIKGGSGVKDLGCTIPELKIYLASKFKPGMNWSNWTFHGWHLDHIIPISKFDLGDREQFLKACNYTNLQPLWAKENMEKSDKIMWASSLI